MSSVHLASRLRFDMEHRILEANAKKLHRTMSHLVIKIKMFKGGREFPMDVDLTTTIAELKSKIAGQSDVPVENMRLVCAGKIWNDVATVGSYEPSDDKVICLNIPPKKAPPAVEQTLSAANPMQDMTGSGAKRPYPTAESPAAAEQTLSLVHPMQAMMLGGAAPPPAQGAGGDSFQQMMAQSQQMIAQNPEMMQQVMDSPMVHEMMSNPEAIRAMLSMDPRIQQLMEQRPEIARILQDPEMIQQSMQVARNPSLMREMQRNQDLSIKSLDAIPGGHQALLRAHEEMIDPMMSAFSGGDDAPDTAFAAENTQTQGVINTEALPNPWGAPIAVSSPAAAAAQAATATPAFSMMGARPATLDAPGANPFAAMMGSGDWQAGANENPMAAVMQQVMSDPAMMQDHMQLTLQMQQGAGGFAPADALPQADTTVPAAGNPPAANPVAAMMAGNSAPQPGANANPMAWHESEIPMAAMMQPLMGTYPAMMQQSMQLAQQMQQGLGAGFGGSPGVSFPAHQEAVEDDAIARVRFASQLAELSEMGFRNEVACLRALQQNHGRLDAAIDALAANEESSVDQLD